MILAADTYWIAHTGTAVVHEGFVEAECEVSTGQETLETFTDRELWITRLAELGIILDAP